MALHVGRVIRDLGVGEHKTVHRKNGLQQGTWCGAQRGRDLLQTWISGQQITLLVGKCDNSWHNDRDYHRAVIAASAAGGEGAYGHGDGSEQQDKWACVCFHDCSIWL